MIKRSRRVWPLSSFRDAAGNILAVYSLASDYGRTALFSQIHTGFISAYSGRSLAGFIRLLADGSPSLANTVLDQILSVQNSWASGEINAHDPAYYFTAEPEMAGQVLRTTDEYLDELRNYNGGSNVTGQRLTVDALIAASTGIRSHLFEEVLQIPAAGEAMLRVLAGTLDHTQLANVWEHYGAVFQPSGYGVSAQNLYAVVSGNGQFSALADDMSGQLLVQASSQEQEAFYSSFVSNGTIQANADLRLQPGTVSGYEQQLMDILNEFGDRHELPAFLATWSGINNWLNMNVTPKHRLELVYFTEAEDLLDRIISQDIGIVNVALASEPSLSFPEYGAKMVLAGYPAPMQNVSSGSALIAEELSLAEHHLYGAGRLGIQRYDNAVGGTTSPQQGALKNKWSVSNSGPSGTFYNLTSQKASWWSYAYSDLMDKGSRTVSNANRDQAGNVSNLAGSGTTDGSGVFSYTGYRNARRTLGWRQYELSDHLGNVLASVLDRKLGSAATHTDGNGATVVNYFTADVSSAQDYYPFGMLMPGRTFTLAGMDGRFGFNGKSSDKEVYGKGNFQDYGLRNYDPRIARFFSSDPMFGKFPWWSTYQFAGNRPTRYIDLDGAEPAEAPQSLAAIGPVNEVYEQTFRYQVRATDKSSGKMENMWIYKDRPIDVLGWDYYYFDGKYDDISKAWRGSWKLFWSDNEVMKTSALATRQAADVIEKSFAALMFIGVAAPAVVETGAGAALNTGFRLGLKYSGQALNWGLRKYGGTFATEVMKSVLANRFDVNRMDWFDISLNTLTSGQGGRYKLALQVAVKTVNSLVDIKQNGGFQSVFTGNKKEDAISLDLQVNGMKIMNGLMLSAAGDNGIGRMFTDMIADQYKTQGKEDAK